MFKNILSLWKGQEFLKKVLADFTQILESAQAMFALVRKKLIHNENIEELEEQIYSLDKKINSLEKEIRKRVVEHLVIQPTVDLSLSLVLMSVVKDAERLGDYCKNLFEVTKLLDQPLNQAKYKELFGTLDEELEDFFKKTKVAFIESDQTVAAMSWEYKDKIAKTCDQAIRKLAKSDLKANEAVCFTLVARHFKRLSSHLVNIATSVILPVDQLDYFDENKKKELGQ